MPLMIYTRRQACETLFGEPDSIEAATHTNVGLQRLIEDTRPDFEPLVLEPEQVARLNAYLIATFTPIEFATI